MKVAIVWTSCVIVCLCVMAAVGWDKSGWADISSTTYWIFSAVMSAFSSSVITAMCFGSHK